MEDQGLLEHLKTWASTVLGIVTAMPSSSTRRHAPPCTLRAWLTLHLQDLDIPAPRTGASTRGNVATNDAWHSHSDYDGLVALSSQDAEVNSSEKAMLFTTLCITRYW